MGNDLSNPETLFQLAAWYHDRGDLEEAKSRYLRTLKLDPKCSVTWNELALVHYAQGDYTEAIDCLDLAIQLKPKSAIHHANMASALHMWEAAEIDIIASLIKALELDTKSADYYPEIYQLYLSPKEIKDIKLRSKASILPWLFAATLAGAGISNATQQLKSEKSLKTKRVNL